MNLIKTALDTVLFDTTDGPLCASLDEGAPDSRLTVVVGDNASGKSFFVRLLASFCNSEKPKIEPIQVSMRYRTMSGMHRAFMYGPFGDEIDSTGNVSMIALQGALTTAKGRERPHWLMLDEPDTGLSDAYARALGTWLAGELHALPERTAGSLVVTHSKALVDSIFRHSPVRPWFIHMGEPLSAEQWLSNTSEKSVEELLALSNRALDLHRAIERRVNRARNDKE